VKKKHKASIQNAYFQDPHLKTSLGADAPRPRRICSETVRGDERHRDSPEPGKGACGGGECRLWRAAERGDGRFRLSRFIVKADREGNPLGEVTEREATFAARQLCEHAIKKAGPGRAHKCTQPAGEPPSSPESSAKIQPSALLVGGTKLRDCGKSTQRSALHAGGATLRGPILSTRWEARTRKAPRKKAARLSASRRASGR